MPQKPLKQFWINPAAIAAVEHGEATVIAALSLRKVLILDVPMIKMSDLVELVKAADTYRNHSWCDCGCENCTECARGCIIRNYFDEVLGEIRMAIAGGV